MFSHLKQGYILERLLISLGIRPRQKALLAQSRKLYTHIVAAARQPVFYRDWAVRDDKDGRFEMLCLHLFLILERIRQEPCEMSEDDPALIGQFLSEVAVADLEYNLREMGVGDLAVGRRVQKYTKRQYARFALYRTIFSPDGKGMEDPLPELITCVYCDESGFAPIQAKHGAENLMEYIRKSLLHLSAQPIEALLYHPRFLPTEE